MKQLAILVAILALAPGLYAQANAPRQPVARVGDQTIYEEDLLPSIGAQLFQLRNQEFELKSKALKSVIAQRLMEAEAKKKGLSADAYLVESVDKNVPAPGASEIEAYYLAQKDRINQPLDKVRPQIEQALTQAKRQQARQDYLEQLQSRGDVTILLSRPKVDVSPDPLRVKGNPDAPVTIVEFADFQCPYCGTVQPALKSVLEKYQGKVRFGFRDFPLRSIHPQAQMAAEASHCAGEQGKFWEYHDLLYANQSRLDQAGLTDQARTAGLDVERFGSCLTSGKFKAQIDIDLQAGTISGVSGTPAFFINGVLLSGAQPASAFESIIDSGLAETSAKKSPK
jgi:protein-disulfide isomerase